MREKQSNPLSNSSLGPRTNFPIVSIAEVPVLENSADAGQDRPIVLVVNKEPAIAENVREILNQNGYAAIVALDAREALETALLIPPELIIAEVALPGMSGIEVAAALRTELPDCRALLLLAPDASADPEALANTTVHKFGFVGKPIQPVDLLAQVSATLKL
jgi:DNA-binding response OmpR family regulator